MSKSIYANLQFGRILRFTLACTIGCFWPFVETVGAEPFYSGVAPNSLTPRSALVIGVGDYETLRPLGANPINDANKVADLLTATGFGRVIRTPPNPRRNDILDSLDELEATVARDPGVMLVYYSGHGISADGHAYLVPADARLRSPQDLIDRMIPLRRIYDAVRRAKPRQAILIFDACRNNPFNGLNSIEWETGLKAAEYPPFGMYVAFSTIDGKTASNGALDNSPFTAIFLQWATQEPALSEVFTRVREVLATPLIQQPSTSLDSFVGHFKFMMAQTDFETEQGEYLRVHNNDISSLYETFMNTYRSGYFYNTAGEDLAKAKQREALKASATIAPANPTQAASPSSVVPTPLVPGTINSDVELYVAPDLSGKPVRIVSKGTAAVISGRTGDVFKVALVGGEGYLPQTAIDVAPSLERASTIQVSSTGGIPSTAAIEQAAKNAVGRDETVVVQATIPSGAASDKATIGLKAALDVLDIFRQIGVAMDKVVVSPTLRQGPEFAVQLLNVPQPSVAMGPERRQGG
jgi:hypothetical protein